MSALKEVLEKALAKASDSSEAKLLAEFVQDILDDNGDRPALVEASMETLISWALRFRDAARHS